MPFSTAHLWVVPIDDHSAWRYNFVTRPTGYDNPRQVDWIADTSGQARAQSRAVPGHPGKRMTSRSGVQERLYTAANEYGIDRSVQKDLSSTGSYSGITFDGGGTQDFMVTETMGPIYDRAKEHLGTTDIAIVKLRATLLQAARDLAAGKEPPAVSGEHDYRSMRAAEKILAPGEDWRVLGTNEDPMVQEAEALGRQ
jgi:phthalate 4,5-dioxygenase oxygenase subunit